MFKNKREKKGEATMLREVRSSQEGKNQASPALLVARLHTTAPSILLHGECPKREMRMSLSQIAFEAPKREQVPMEKKNSLPKWNSRSTDITFLLNSCYSQIILLSFRKKRSKKYPTAIKRTSCPNSSKKRDGKKPCQPS